MKNRPNAIMASLVVFFIFLISSSSYTQNLRYIGIYKGGNGANIVTSSLSWSAFMAEGENQIKKGLRLIDIETFLVGNTRKYIGVFKEGAGANIVTSPLSWDAFMTEGENQIKKGLRLIDIETFLVGNTRKYIGIFREGTGANIVTGPLNWNAFINEKESRLNQGLQLINIESFTQNEETRYIGIFKDKKVETILTERESWNNFNKKQKDLLKNGFILDDLEVIIEHANIKYIGVFSRDKNKDYQVTIKTNSSSIDEYKATRKDLLNRNYSQIELTRKDNNGINNYEARFIEKENEILVQPPFTNLNDFMKNGELLIKKGLRLIDFEVITLPKPKPKPKPKPGSGPNGPLLPKTQPKNIIIEENGNEISIDFIQYVQGLGPKITIPRSVLPLLPTTEDGDIIFPDNICGFRIYSAENFFWQNQDKAIPESVSSPYKSAESLEEIEDGVYYYGGFDITGPLGRCKNDSGPWHFPLPLTSSGKLDPNNANVILVINTTGFTKIEFLNHNYDYESNITEPWELFSGDATAGFKEFWRYWKETERISTEFKDFFDAVCYKNPLSCIYYD